MIAQFDYLAKFQQEDSSGVGVRHCPNLTTAHVSKSDFDKMKVQNATQLFSRSVSAGKENEIYLSSNFQMFNSRNEQSYC